MEIIIALIIVAALTVINEIKHKYELRRLNKQIEILSYILGDINAEVSQTFSSSSDSTDVDTSSLPRKTTIQ